MDRLIKAGTTDVSIHVYIIDSTDGTPETGVVFDTAGIDLKYRREGAVVVAITEADLVTPALDDAHADGGFLEVGNGVYRLDLPDAACAAGAKHVTVFGTVTGMIVLPVEIQLVAFDPDDAVRMGLTSLPNAAADAAGGLPISDAGGLDMDAAGTGAARALAALPNAAADAAGGLPVSDVGGLDMDAVGTGAARALTALPNAAADAAGGVPISDAGGLDLDTKLANTHEVTAARMGALTDLIDGGRLDVLIDAIKVATDRLTAARAGALTDWVDGGRLDVLLDAIKAVSDASHNLSAAEVNAEVADVVNTDTSAEPGQGAPPATASLRLKNDYLYKAWRNKVLSNANVYELYNDDALTVDQKAAQFDDNVDFIRGEIASGP